MPVPGVNDTAADGLADAWLDDYLSFGDVEIWRNCVWLAVELAAMNLIAYGVLVLKRPKFLRLAPPRGGC